MTGKGGCCAAITMASTDRSTTVGSRGKSPVIIMAVITITYGTKAAPCMEGPCRICPDMN